MATREAACSCGQLRLTAEGEPVRISICHCLACQRRSGSVFGAQARFPADRVHVEGRYVECVRISDEGEARTFRFCPDCGATLFYTTADAPELIAVLIGAFADPSFRRRGSPLRVATAPVGVRAGREQARRALAGRAAQALRLAAPALLLQPPLARGRRGLRRAAAALDA